MVLFSFQQIMELQQIVLSFKVVQQNPETYRIVQKLGDKEFHLINMFLLNLLLQHDLTLHIS